MKKNRLKYEATGILLLVAFLFSISFSLREQRHALQWIEDDMEVITSELQASTINKDLLLYLTKLHDQGKYDFYIYENGQAIYTSNQPLDQRIVRQAIRHGKYNRSVIYQRNELTNKYIYLHRFTGGTFVASYMNHNILGYFFYSLPYFLVPLIVGGLILRRFLLKTLKKKEEEVAFSIAKVREELPLNKTDDLFHLDLFIQKLADSQQKLQQLEALSSNYEEMIAKINEGIIIIDDEQRIKLLNESAIELLGGSLRLDYIDKNIINLCRENNFIKALEKNMNERVYAVQTVYVNDEPLEIVMAPILLKDHKFLGMSILIFDMSEKKDAEKNRQQFTSNVTHELKTPLTSVRGYAELLQSTNQDPQEQKFLGIIIEESERLLSLIDEIIALNRVEEHIHIDNEDIDIKALVQKILSRKATSIDEKSLHVDLSIPEGLTLYSDYKILREIFGNLIDNAILYNVEEGILQIQAQETDDYVIVTIGDSGIGISYKDQQHIFERFYMADKSRSYNKKSTGLGLAIVKHHLERIHGEILVQSKLGVGTKITVTLPKTVNPAEES